jgi:hypothetical protein
LLLLLAQPIKPGKAAQRVSRGCSTERGKPMLEVTEEFQVRLGGNTYINTTSLIVCKGAPLFQLRRNQNKGLLEIDFDVFDSGGRRVCVFRNGIVARGDSAPYIVSARHDQYRVTERFSGRKIATIKRHFGTGDLDVWLELYTPRGQLFVATPTEANFQSGGQSTGSVIIAAQNGIVIE